MIKIHQNLQINMIYTILKIINNKYHIEKKNFKNNLLIDVTLHLKKKNENKVLIHLFKLLNKNPTFLKEKIRMKIKKEDSYHQ
jgi:hypothetical protein